MKRAALLLLTSLTLFCEDRLIVGGGAYIQTQPYQACDSIVLPTPVIFADYGIFYIRWSQVGVYFYGKESWGVSLTAQPRVYGYTSDASAVLTGMKERKNGFEGGISVAGKNRYGFAEAILFTDILDNTNRYRIRGEIGTSLEYGKFSLYPSLVLLYNSRKFNDYYYGVKREESNESRPFYRVDAGFNAALQSYINYQYNKTWGILTYIRADYLNDTIQKSPIVADRFIYSGMVSVTYRFF